MTNMVERNLAEIAELCRKYGVRKLSIFGSGVRGDFAPQSSDLDFLVEFAPMPPRDHKEAYFSLLEGLEALLMTEQIDLVELAAVKNPFVKARIERGQETVYDAA
jgi:predicted nucleotidyltransferase